MWRAARVELDLAGKLTSNEFLRLFSGLTPPSFQPSFFSKAAGGFLERSGSLGSEWGSYPSSLSHSWGFGGPFSAGVRLRSAVAFSGLPP